MSATDGCQLASQEDLMNTPGEGCRVAQECCLQARVYQMQLPQVMQ